MLYDGSPSWKAVPRPLRWSSALAVAALVLRADGRVGPGRTVKEETLEVVDPDRRGLPARLHA